MKRIPLTHGKFAIVDDVDFEKVTAQCKWRTLSGKNGKFYAVAHRWGNDSMHVFLMKPPQGMKVDHVNGNGLDNRRENLRIATNSQNGMNRGKFRNNTSGYKGVVFQGGKWQAQINVLSTRIRKGGFASAEEAAHAYDEMALKYHGEFAYLNFKDGMK